MKLPNEKGSVAVACCVKEENVVNRCLKLMRKKTCSSLEMGELFLLCILPASLLKEETETVTEHGHETPFFFG